MLMFLKEVFTLKKKLLLIIHSPPCHLRCPCLSFFRRKEIKVFDENIPGFSADRLSCKVYLQP